MDSDEYNAEAAEYGDEQYGEEYEQNAMDDDMGFAGQQMQEHNGTGMEMGHAASTRHEQEDRTQALQSKLAETLKDASKWRNAFKEVASIVGFTSGATREPDVQAVIESVQRMKQQGSMMQDEIKDLHRREAALQIALADRNFEAAELRKEVAAGWTSLEPQMQQLRQLMLDPAVNREFVRLRAELDEAHKELKRVQEELAVAHFTADSKVGRQLMAKCRALADENDQMGAELAEGKVQQLEQQLTMSRGCIDELKMQVSDLLEHCGQLNDEVEALQRESFALRRKVKDYENAAQQFDNRGMMMQGGSMDMPGPGMGPGGMAGSGGPHMMGPGGPGMMSGRGGFRGGRGGRGFRGGGRGGGMPPPHMMGPGGPQHMMGQGGHMMNQGPR